MKRAIAAAIILFAAALFAGFAAGQSAPPRIAEEKAAVQPKYALLVGVSEYQNPAINKIDGCRNNVPLLAETLIKDYGFLPGGVVTLLDERATKDAIIANFQRHLIGSAERAAAGGQEAVIVYYFCGHGSQYPDQDGDENDGLDETFVAYDSRSRSFDILDDEIDDLKTELRNFTTNTTLILESCHSGTGSKGNAGSGELVSEETADDGRVRPPYRRKYQPTGDGDALTYTEIAASLSTNTAKSETAEFCQCAKPQSLMTKALIQGLKRATYTTTYRGLMREVAAEVAGLSRQEPQVEGNRDALLFGGAAKRAKPYIEIEKLLPNNRLIVKAGAIHGLKEGSQISIYSARSLTNTGKTDWLANAFIRQVGTASSVAQLPDAAENPLVKTINVASHAVLASPIFGGGSILFVPETNGATLTKKIEQELTNENLIENQVIKIAAGKLTVADKKTAKGIVRLQKGRVRDVFSPAGAKKPFPISPLLPSTVCEGSVLKTNAAENRFPAADSEVYYLDDGDAGGAPLFGQTFDPANAGVAGEIAAALRNYAYQGNLSGLDNAASTLSAQIGVSIQAVTGAEINEKCSDKGAKVIKPNGEKFKGFRDVKNNTVAVNSFVQLTLKNISGDIRRRKDVYASGESLYLAVVAVTTTGEIKNLYGSTGADKPIRDGGEAKILLKIAEPVGVEKIIVFVSKENFDFSFYESKTKSAGGDFDLGKLLTQSGAKSRDAGALVKNEPDSWDVIHLDLKITP